MSTRAQKQTLAIGVSGGGVAANPSDIAARKEQLKMEVVEPWKHLIRSSVYAANSNKIPDGVTVDKSISKQLAAATSANNQAQAQSWLILLDFADYLQLHLKPVWDCVVDPTQSQTILTTQTQRNLFNWLKSAGTDPAPVNQLMMAPAPVTPTFAWSLLEALQKIRKTEIVRTSLENATQLFPDVPDKNNTSLAWPDFAYLLAGVRKSGSSYAAWGIHSSLDTMGDLVADVDDKDALTQTTSEVMKAADTQTAILDKLVQLVILAIDTTKPAQPAPPLPYAVRLRDALATTSGDDGWFSMRCAYVRCDCGPQNVAVLSTSSQHFQMANFFDPDAPARAIRITLPLDTTPAGMRKHSKNTAFMISDVLCGQIQRAKGLGLVDLVLSVLPWPFHKDLDVGGMGPCKNSKEANIGMICSLSIPIITICALILLMIIVSLLDLIFKWMPWFTVCFPIPGFKAKKDN